MSAFPARFSGRTALITGASRGIGLAIAQRLVDEGATVCITARKAEPLQHAVEQLGGAEVAISVPGAADDAEHQRIAIETVRQRFGRLDILVNNTGINPLFGPVLESDVGAMRKILEVNLLANIAWVQQARALGFEQTGVVVNVASVAGLRPARNIGVYGVSKAALMQLTRQLALELAPEIRVNAVAPAVVRTRFGGPLFEGKEDEVAGLYPLGTLGTPQDVAAAVAYLASDDAAWITGQVLTLDGGLTLTGGI